MTLSLTVTHLLTLALGAGVLWSWQRLRTARALRAADSVCVSENRDETLGAAGAAMEAAHPVRQLQELVERFHLAADAAGIAVWEWDIARNEVVADARMTNAKVYGHIGSRLDLRSFVADVVYREDRDQFVNRMRDAFAEGEYISYRFRINGANGSPAHIQLHARVIRNRNGQPRRVLGVAIDVTEQAAASERLEQRAEQERALRARLNLATHSAGIGIWDVDVRTGITRTDATIRDLLGVTREVEKPMRFVHPDDYPQVKALVLGALHGAPENIVSFRYRIVRSDKAQRHIQTHVRLLCDARGNAEHLLGVSWDVTAEVEHAEQLQQQADHVRTLLDRLGVATQAAGVSPWEFDLRSNRFLWIENRSKAFATGDIPADDVGDLLQKVMHPEDYEKMQRELGESIKSGAHHFSHRFRIERADGTVRHMQSYAEIVRDANGAPRRLLGATTDVTNEVQTNDMLVRQADQERALLDRLSIATKAAGISSWEIDLERGVFLWIENPVSGLEAGVGHELSLEKFSESIHPDDRGLFAIELRSALREKRDQLSYRYRLYVEDRQLIHVQMHARLLPGEDGRMARLLGVTWDVTKEIEATAKFEQQALQERMLLDRVNMAAEAAGISSWEMDMDAQRFIRVDARIKALHGVTDFDGTSAAFYAHVHPDDRHIFVEATRQTLKNKGDRFSCRYRVPLANGKLAHIQTHARIMFDTEGHGRRILGVSWDVTKEVEAAEQLRDAERRLERASLSSSEGHWECDLLTRRRWFSSSYHALLGYADGELPQQISAFEELIHPEDLSISQAALLEHLTNGTPFICDVRVRSKAGEYRWLRKRGMAERNARGEPVSLSGSVHDIQEQKLAEDALRLAQQRFERAIKGTQDGLWELDACGAAWCSPRVAELLGYESNGLPSDTNFLHDYLHPDDTSALATAAKAHFQQGTPYDVEIRLLTKRGDYRWYRARASADRDATGRPLRLSGSLQDVTDARAAREALLRATEAAEAANRAKSEFLANVSHEIRTPMNGIIGMTGLLLDTTLDRTQRDYSETIRASADSLLIVINDILDFSKIEAGKLDIEAIDLDLRGTVEEVGGMMALQAAAKHLELIVHVHPNVPSRVTSDPQRLRQCLVNLVGNAIKFTRAGEIVIEVSNIGERDGRVLTRFEVRDTGIGIAPATLRTLFQPFVQADSSTTRHFGGTGLGLSIVRRLIEMMGGEVGARSELAKGSAFWFTLPLSSTGSAPFLEEADLTRLGRRILVVDDNETNRRVVAGQLMHAGYEVSLASSGLEALALMRQALVDEHPYEAVLADYRMQDMDGAALGERINADPQTAQSRIVMLTSVDQHGDVRRFASLGFAGYLTKPIRSRELLECLDRVLSCDAKQWHLQSQPIVTRGALFNADTTRYRGRVLLVEDNAVNQKVALRFLERMGCSVRIADNGAEAVKAYGEGKFDVVLMDLQMPVMDGLAATRRIRELEADGPRTPIVALTANAMTGQLERCTEAGMNGFLTKPIELSRLREALDRYGLGLQPAAQVSQEQTARDSSAPIHLARLNELTGDDTDFAHELATTFIASGEQVLNEISSAVAVFDRTALSRAAHKLKGASANIHADALCELALALETQASQLDQPRLKELIADLREEFDRAAEFLRQQAPAPNAKVG